MNQVPNEQRLIQLGRKLQLLLGSQKNWLAIYDDWCAEHSVSSTQAFEDHNIGIFVKQQREGVKCR